MWRDTSYLFISKSSTESAPKNGKALLAVFLTEQSGRIFFQKNMTYPARLIFCSVAVRFLTSIIYQNLHSGFAKCAMYGKMGYMMEVFENDNLSGNFSWEEIGNEYSGLKPNLTKC